MRSAAKGAIDATKNCLFADGKETQRKAIQHLKVHLDGFTLPGPIRHCIRDRVGGFTPCGSVSADVHTDTDRPSPRH
jgi:hypothetical protein